MAGGIESVSQLTQVLQLKQQITAENFVQCTKFLDNEELSLHCGYYQQNT